MSSSTTPGDDGDLSLRGQHEKRRAVCVGLFNRGGEASAASLAEMDLFRDAEQVRYHADQLATNTPAPVERTGEHEDVGAPNPSVVYRLTEAGEQATKELIDEAGGPDSEIEELRGEVRRAHDRIDQLVELLRQAGVEDVEGTMKEN